MLRPLPPFRMSPSRKAAVPKAPGKSPAEVLIKPGRQPVRPGRLAAQAVLRILPPRSAEPRTP